MAHYLKIGDEKVEVPPEVRFQDGDGPNPLDWIIDELLKRKLIAFDPRDLSVEEMTEKIEDVDDPHVLGLMRDAETRSTAVQALEARAAELTD